MPSFVPHPSSAVMCHSIKVTGSQYLEFNGDFGIIDFVLTGCYCEHYGIREYC
jgi:hypothetical protein